MDAPRVHYEEIRITATFHHTPRSVRGALRLIVSGEIDPSALISAHEPLSRLPAVMAEMAHGGDGLKTAITP